MRIDCGKTEEGAGRLNQPQKFCLSSEIHANLKKRVNVFCPQRHIRWFKLPAVPI